MAKFKVGQNVRVVKSGRIKHYLRIGSEARISSFDRLSLGCVTYVCIGDYHNGGGICFQTVNEEDLEAIKIPNKGHAPDSIKSQML